MAKIPVSLRLIDRKRVNEGKKCLKKAGMKNLSYPEATSDSGTLRSFVNDAVFRHLVGLFGR